MSLPLRISFSPTDGAPVLIVLTGLDASTSSVVPSWAREHVAAETWIGQGLEVTALRRAADSLPTKFFLTREEPSAWFSGDGSIGVDLTLPLLLLARDLEDLGRTGVLTLGGA